MPSVKHVSHPFKGPGITKKTKQKKYPNLFKESPISSQ